MNSIFKDSAVTFISRGAALLIGMINGVIISRILGPASKGAYSLIILVMSVFSLLTTFGLGSANVYYGARFPNDLGRLLGNSLFVAVLIGSLGTLAIQGLCFVPFCQDYLAQNGVDLGVMRLVALVLPLMQISAFIREIVRGSGSIVRYNLLNLVHLGLTAVSNFIFVFWMRRGLVGALISWSLALIVISLLTTVVALRLVRQPLRLDRSTLGRSFQFGMRLYAGNIAQFLNYRLDQFLVGLFMTSTEIGLYATAANLAEKLWEIPHAIRTVLLYQVAAQEDVHAADRATARVSRVTFALIGILCVGLALSSTPLIWGLYGRDFLPAAQAIMLLMPGIWALSIGKMLAVHLSGRGKPQISSWGAIISLVSTLILDILLIPAWGINGAAVASSVSYIMVSVIMLVYFSRITELSFVDVLVPTKADVQLIVSKSKQGWHQFVGWMRSRSRNV